MKKILICLFLAPPLFSFSQASGLSTSIPFGSYGFINGKSTYSRQDASEEGAYMFPKTLSPANVTLKNGRYYPNIKIMLNLMDNEMIFADSTGQTYSSIVPIEQIEFLPIENGATKTVFKTGFPAVGDADENTFYEVLADGPMMLLRSNKISYIDKTILGRSVSTRVYDNKQTIYAYDKKLGMKKISKSKTELESLFGGNTKMQTYLSSHKIRSESDMVGTFKYYNSL